jgi:sugar/nucleoside kinase (ribokinase family)
MVDVFCIGNPLLDIIVPVDEETLTSLRLKKGIMNIVDENGIDQVLEKIKKGKSQLIPAGSEANAMMGLSRLGSSVFFCGKVGDDEHGAWYAQAITKTGVTHHLPREWKTGRVIALITPDTERTMVVYLGATQRLRSLEVPTDMLLKARLFYTTGYLLNNPEPREATLAAFHLAKGAGIPVAFDLADAGLVQHDQDFLRSIVADYVDLLFMNEAEALAMTGKQEEEALRDVGRHTQVCVLKIGSRGSLICKGGKITRIPAIKVKAVDTTGAGDWYAAGFMHGFVHGSPLEACGRLGTYVASLIVQQHGAYTERDLREDARRILGQ